MTLPRSVGWKGVPIAVPRVQGGDAVSRVVELAASRGAEVVAVTSRATTDAVRQADRPTSSHATSPRSTTPVPDAWPRRRPHLPLTRIHQAQRSSPSLGRT